MRPDESPEERVSRMAAEGLISARQAERLRAGLATGKTASPVGAERPARRPGLLWLMLTFALVVAAFLIVIGIGGGGEPTVQNVAQDLNQPGVEGEMNKSLQLFLVIALLVVLPVLVVVWSYNGLVTKEEKVFEAWAQTESTLQRRADLVPALVETVSRYLKHEAETLEKVSQARAGSADALEKTLEALIAAQEEQSGLLREHGAAILNDEAALAALFGAGNRLAQGMTGLVAVAEDYPELRSADQFLELQTQLEGTENRINVARIRFNDAVRAFNGAMRRLPGSLVAGLGNFQRKAYFRSEEEARNAPDLDF